MLDSVVKEFFTTASDSKSYLDSIILTLFFLLATG